MFQLKLKTKYYLSGSVTVCILNCNLIFRMKYKFITTVITLQFINKKTNIINTSLIMLDFNIDNGGIMGVKNWLDIIL